MQKTIHTGATVRCKPCEEGSVTQKTIHTGATARMDDVPGGKAPNLCERDSLGKEPVQEPFTARELYGTKFSRGRSFTRSRKLFGNVASTKYAPTYQHSLVSHALRTIYSPRSPVGPKEIAVQNSRKSSDSGNFRSARAFAVQPRFRWSMVHCGVSPLSVTKSNPVICFNGSALGSNGKIMLAKGRRSKPGPHAPEEMEKPWR